MRCLTSIVQLLFNLVLFPFSRGTPSMKSGRFPSFVMKKSPLLRSLIVPWRRDTLCAGPSSNKSTSTLSWSDFLPNVIYLQNKYKPNLIETAFMLLHEMFRLTSRDLIKYRTKRPRSTANVWLSNSGWIPMPVIESTSTVHRGSSFSKWRISFLHLRSANASSNSRASSLASTKSASFNFSSWSEKFIFGSPSGNVVSDVALLLVIICWSGNSIYCFIKFQWLNNALAVRAG